VIMAFVGVVMRPFSRFRLGIVFEGADRTQRFAFRGASLRRSTNFATSGGCAAAGPFFSGPPATPISLLPPLCAGLDANQHTVAGDIPHSMVRGFASRVKPVSPLSVALTGTLSGHFLHSQSAADSCPAQNCT
jgi:hypothetical protein